MTVIGGDLGAMDQLARRFGQAGQTFQGQSNAISGRVTAALDAFTEEMRALDQEARMLADEISQEMVRLNGQAAATQWTGANRDQMDTIVAALDDDIVAVHGAIVGFVDEASSVVNGSLTTTMTTLGSNVDTAGTNALGVSDSFATNVQNQRNAFDQVLNG